MTLNYYYYYDVLCATRSTVFRQMILLHRRIQTRNSQKKTRLLFNNENEMANRFRSLTLFVPIAFDLISLNHHYFNFVFTESGFVGTCCCCAATCSNQILSHTHIMNVCEMWRFAIQISVIISNGRHCMGLGFGRSF